MPFFAHSGLRLSYSDEGSGPPVLLIHGFASNARVNWFDTGWVDFLLKAGRRVIAIDNRGHGLSDKPHDPQAYDAPLMAEDALALLDHLKIKKADVMGYSMGGRIAAFLSLAHPDRVCSAVLAGVGANLTEGGLDPTPVIAALEAPSLADVTDERGRMFRAFAEQTKSDLKALSACMRGPRKKILPEQFKELRIPVLVAVGSKDAIAAGADRLTKLMPNARQLDIVGRDHMRAVGDRQYKEGVLEFWNKVSPCSAESKDKRHAV